MSQLASEHLGESLGTDFFSVREQFTDEQWEHFITVRRFVDEEVVPVVGPYWERAEICWPLVKRLPELGIVGEDIKGYGCAGMSPMACGLVTMELHRGDGSLGVFLGVHAGLAMLSIAMCGSEEQKARWLPDMAQMNKLGAFALTEPEHGSDSVALETSARPDSDGWVLNGRKRWIGLGSVADLVVVWARNTEDGQVNGFVVEKGSPGCQARVIEGKVSLRSVWQAEITLENVRVPAENRLTEARSFKDTTRVLATTRSTCAWAALGHATAAYDAALRYALERRQFGEQLAGFQIIQQRLVSMLADLTAMQLYCLQIGRLAEAAADPHRGRAGQDAQHPQGPRDNRRGARHARRQRHPARLPGHAAHGGHGGDPHLRGHRDHADAYRRPRHHRHRSLHVAITRPVLRRWARCRPGRHFPIRALYPTGCRGPAPRRRLGGQRPDADQEVVAAFDQPQTGADQHQPDEHRGYPLGYGRPGDLIEGQASRPYPRGCRSSGRRVLTQPLTSADEQRVRAFLRDYPGVTAIHEVLVTFTGPGRVWVTARLDPPAQQLCRRTNARGQA